MSSSVVPFFSCPQSLPASESFPVFSHEVANLPMNTQDWSPLGWTDWISLRSKGISSVRFSRSVVSNSLRPHESQHARPPCPSPTLGVHPDSHPWSQRCHPAISSSVVPFSSCIQSFPASGSFPVSQFFTSCGQSIGLSASASVLPMNIQD